LNEGVVVGWLFRLSWSWSALNNAVVVVVVFAWILDCDIIANERTSPMCDDDEFTLHSIYLCGILVGVVVSLLSCIQFFLLWFSPLSRSLNPAI
jgi:hypothetical protein